MPKYWIIAGVSLLTLACLVSGGCSKNGWCLQETHWVERTDTLTLKATGVNSFKTKVHNGSIKITAREDGVDEILVVVVCHGGSYSTEDAQRCLDAMVIKAILVDGQQIVTQDWEEIQSPNWRTKLEMEILAPERLAANLRTHNGGIRVDSMKGNCDLHGHNGSIVLNGGGENVKASLHNGSLQVTTAASTLNLSTHNGTIDTTILAEGEVDTRLVSHNGTIKIALGSQVSGELHCSTHNGGIHPNIQVERVDMPSKRTLVVQLKDRPSDGKILAKTHNGSIHIREASNTKAASL